MNTKNIYVGKETRNLSVLCEEVFGEKPKGGKQLELMKKEMKLYFNWISEGRKQIITEIYDTPKEKFDNRGKSEGSRGNNNKYQNDMSILIEHYLATSRQEELQIAISTLAYGSKIISNIYTEYRKDEDNCFEKLNNITNRTAFKNTMFYYKRIITDSVYGALKSLQKQEKLEYERTTFIVIDNEVKPTTEKMDKTLNEIKSQVLQEIIYEYSYGKRQLTRKAIMNIPRLRKKYYAIVFKRFTKKYTDVTNLFEGVTIHTLNCREQENIIEVSNRLNDTLMTNVEIKIKKQVTKVKEQYRKNIEEKSIAFGEEHIELMKPYERDIIENELSYIEDTITLTKLLCGQINQHEKEKADTKEQNLEIELSQDDIYLDSGIIDISKLDEVQISKYKKYKQYLFKNAMIWGFRNRKTNDYYKDIPIDDEEHMTLGMIITDLSKEMQKKKAEINSIEDGIREGNLLELKREMRRLEREFDEVNSLIMSA